jgi:replicative superfamily II helicase
MYWTPVQNAIFSTKLLEALSIFLHVQIALVLIDEVHLLNESRGAALEAGCISRIRMVSQLPEMSQACAGILSAT